MDTATAGNGTIVQEYCIPVGEKEHGQERVLESIKIERPKVCWKASAAVFRKILNDFDTEEQSNLLPFFKKNNSSGPPKAQCHVAPAKSLYPVQSKDLKCSINSRNKAELQVRGGSDWITQLQTPSVKLLDSALTHSPSHNSSQGLCPRTHKGKSVFEAGGFMGKGKITEKATQVSTAWFCTF